MIIQAGEERAGHAVPAGTPCFYCQYPLSGMVIAWWGNGADVYLHPKCTVELSIRLLRDIHEVEHQTRTSITGGPATTPDPRFPS